MNRCAISAPPVNPNRPERGLVQGAERVTILDRILQQAVGALQAKLAADFGAMRFHGARRNKQLRGNVPGRLLVCDPLEDASLGDGQILKARLTIGERRGAVAAPE